MDDNSSPVESRSADLDVMFLFPRWTNLLPTVGAIGGAIGTSFAILLIWYYFSPKHTDVGYQPVQPVPYSHKLHAGDLGLDCRYCHIHVERSPQATVPPTQVCMNCHARVRINSKKLKPIRDSFATGEPIQWVKVHKVPDYAYFDHSRHIARGVGCESCHGRVDQMIEVRQVEPLSMGWCLECHRDPAPHLRPVEDVTRMGWTPPDGESPAKYGQKRIEALEIAPSTDCSGCHR